MLLADVRTAAPGDATAISRLLAEAIRDGYGKALGEIRVGRLVSDHCALPRIRAEIEIPGGAPAWLGWLVAADADGAVVGAASGGVPVASEGEVYALCVTPARRREGIGTALLEAASSRMREHGATSQRITLPVEQAPALPFFARHGFDELTPVRFGRAL
ncbi:GNAT family N-acetyltransferase [Streptomyces sp. NBC_00091]|uniref:GNAT family N-acetyltransferase n=1 Tax=Streptomyces sp. NBC_00091 TaxID=2975648 RepID=UPI0022572392|nr:GNAT family N-acetyltransferase [Streptomyces sp. NBC_00091]MCX5375075.1 GNAT family N-acetyltransferase [Streptomyces sp. NBC_00091]